MTVVYGGPFEFPRWWPMGPSPMPAPIDAAPWKQTWPVPAPMDDLAKEAFSKGLATMTAEELRRYILQLYGIEEKP